jgi:hypothetical protein
MKVEISHGFLNIKLNPLEKFFALHGDLKIPLNRLIHAAPEKAGWQVAAVRAPGTHIPFLLKAGTYHTALGREFWFVTAGRPHLVIELNNWEFNRLVFSPGEAEALATIINQTATYGSD